MGLCYGFFRGPQRGLLVGSAPVYEPHFCCNKIELSLRAILLRLLLCASLALAKTPKSKSDVTRLEKRFGFLESSSARANSTGLFHRSTSLVLELFGAMNVFQPEGFHGNGVERSGRGSVYTEDQN